MAVTRRWTSGAKLRMGRPAIGLLVAALGGAPAEAAKPLCPRGTTAEAGLSIYEEQRFSNEDLAPCLAPAVEGRRRDLVPRLQELLSFAPDFSRREERCEELGRAMYALEPEWTVQQLADAVRGVFEGTAPVDKDEDRATECRLSALAGLQRADQWPLFQGIVERGLADCSGREQQRHRSLGLSEALRAMIRLDYSRATPSVEQLVALRDSSTCRTFEILGGVCGPSAPLIAKRLLEVVDVNRASYVELSAIALTGPELDEVEPVLLRVARFELDRYRRLSPQIRAGLQARGTEKARQLLAEADRTEAEEARREKLRDLPYGRIALTLGLAGLAGLGGLQLAAWEDGAHPWRARDALSGLNTSLTAGALALSATLLTGLLFKGGTHTGSFSDSLGGVGVLLDIAITVGVTLVGIGLGAWAGYALRENRTFYQVVAVAEIVWPVGVGIVLWAWQ